MKAKPSLARQFKALDATRSLHVQLESVRQLQYAERHALDLVRQLAALLARTKVEAPVRKRAYVLERHEAGAPRHHEAKWERAIWSEWHQPSRREFIPGVCRSIVSYQVMLRNSNADDAGWGEIDLLGCSPLGEPVIIELKAPGSTESPLRGLVEVVSYAVALQKSWPSQFGSQWRSLMSSHDSGEPPTIRSVLAAPARYWDRVSGRLGARGQVTKAGWSAIARLLAALEQQNLPVSLVRLDAEDTAVPRGVRGVVIKLTELI